MNEIVQFDKASISEMDKNWRAQRAEAIVTSVTDGNISALDVVQGFKIWKDIFERVSETPAFYEESLNQLSKHGKSAKLYGNTLTESEAGTKYDYSKCGDPVLWDLEANFKEAAERLKARQELLKKVPATGQQIITEPDYEVFTIYPPTKSSKTVITVKLK